MDEHVLKKIALAHEANTVKFPEALFKGLIFGGAYLRGKFAFQNQLG